MSERKGKPYFVRERRRAGNRFGRKPFRKERVVTTEEKIANFVIRNSRNGFFTKIPTLVTKFEISEDEAWATVGSLLDGDSIQCVHNDRGEMKLCERGKSIELLQKEQERRKNPSLRPKKK